MGQTLSMGHILRTRAGGFWQGPRNILDGFWFLVISFENGIWTHNVQTGHKEKIWKIRHVKKQVKPTKLYDDKNKIPKRNSEAFLNLILRSVSLKVVSATFMLVCFLSLNKSIFQIRKNVFLFHFKSSFRSRENQILQSYIFKFRDVIKCLNIKKEIHFTE